MHAQKSGFGLVVTHGSSFAITGPAAAAGTFPRLFSRVRGQAEQERKVCHGL
jgi:hypothetical protein